MALQSTSSGILLEDVLRLCRPWRFTAVLAVLIFAGQVDKSFSLDDPDSRYAAIVEPMVRDFIVDNYAKYAKGAVTLRHLKQHIVDKAGLGLTYDDLRDDRYSAVIEDEVDAIVKRCDGGQKPVACVWEGLKKADEL
mmetsp:Transcript_68564/g.129420  ORF Transcript_68564/g.129420 Transcript_68564/m.129420 type:complete len:137 (-) Transcript_68564:58-468(-)